MRNPVSHVDEARWFIDALSSDITVAGLVPPRFAAYVRILHPAYASHDLRPVRWAEVAEVEGTTLHPLAAFAELVRHDSRERIRWNIEEPDIATLDDKRLAILVDILAEHTTTPEDVWLDLWDGSGHPAAWRGTPRVQQRGVREYYLFRCALGEVVEASAGFDSWPGEDDESTVVFTAEYVGDNEPPEDPPQHPDAPERRIQSPQQWWPDDRAWAVATEIDDDYTVVAGSEDLITAILAHPGLEAFRVGPHDDLSGTSPM